MTTPFTKVSKGAILYNCHCDNYFSLKIQIRGCRMVYLSKMVWLSLGFFLLAGCAGISPSVKENIVFNAPPEKNAKDIRAERLKVKLARYLAVFVCPSEGTFDEYDLNQAKMELFEGENVPNWVVEMNELVQHMTQGRVYVLKGQSDDFLGLYAGKKMSIRVFSHERSRVYTIYEKRTDIYCDSPEIKFSSSFNPG